MDYAVSDGINVNPDDIIVADEESVTVIPKDKAEEIYAQAKTNVEKEREMGFVKWALNHRKKIDYFYN